MILSTFWSSNFYILQRDESNDIKAVTILVVIEMGNNVSAWRGETD